MSRVDSVKKYYIKNKGKISTYKHKWYLENKSYLLEKRKKWHQDNLEKDMVAKKLYRKLKREELSIYMRNYGIARKNEVKSQLGNKCNRCGFLDIRALQIHHKTPKTKTRKMDFLNKNYDLCKIELICANCHMIEHNKFFKINLKKYE